MFYMYLAKIEIQGFKSFAAKTVLTFPAPEHSNRGVTAVVGPNGSGKSNISDAIRWSLGEQSMKSIRGKRFEDVIFFGSHSRSAVGMSEASLFFNNDDHGFPLDYSEVVITRRLYRNGESEYLINKNKVRLSDLILLLAQAHIGQRSYCIVSQGMIDAILTATPAERKGYFDDAAGIREYQLKRDASILKLNATKQNLAQSTLHVKELEPKIRFLERQMKRQAQRAELEERHRELISAYYASVWSEYDRKAESLRASHGRLEEFRTACEQKTESIQQKLSAYQKSHGTSAAADITGLQKDLDTLLVQKNTIHAALAVAQSQAVKHKENTSDAFLALRTNEISEDLQRLSEKYELLQKEINDLTEQEKNAAHDLAAYNQKHPQPPLASMDAVVNGLAAIAALEDQTAKHASHPKLLIFVTHVFTKLRSVIETARAVAGINTAKGEISENFAVSQERDSVLVRLYEVRARKERIEQECVSLESERNQKMRIADSLRVSGNSSSDRIASYQKELQSLDKSIHDIRLRLYNEYASGEEAKTALIHLQKELQGRQRELFSLQKEEHEARVELAKIEAKQEELFKTICDEFRVSKEKMDEFADDTKKLYAVFGAPQALADRDAAKQEIEKLKKTLESIGSVDQEALNEYGTIHERYLFLTKQMSDLEETMKKLENGIVELDQVMEERFVKSMKKINEKFQEYFSSLFDGGSARIVILNEQDEEGQEQEELVSGIDIEASPPGKKLKSISFLSGGERALTAIALLCAILYTNPSPFVVLDEVDAALDESNALRFAAILGDLARKTQFIVITHNRVTIHAAQVLYGVTMGDDGVSHIVSLDVMGLRGTIAQSSIGS